MRDAQGDELFVQSVASLIGGTLRFTTEVDMRREMTGMNVQKSSVLAALLTAFIHLIQRGSTSIGLIKIEQGVHSGNHREHLRMLESQAYSPLPAHADPHDSQCARGDRPPLPKSGNNVLNEKSFRGEPLVEFGATSIHPPVLSPLGTAQSKSKIFCLGRPSIVCTRNYLAEIVQKENGELRGSARRDIEIQTFSMNVNRFPLTAHGCIVDVRAEKEAAAEEHFGLRRPLVQATQAGSRRRRLEVQRTGSVSQLGSRFSRSRLRATWRRRLMVPMGVSNSRLICLSDRPLI